MSENFEIQVLARTAYTDEEAADGRIRKYSIYVIHQNNAAHNTWKESIFTRDEETKQALVNKWEAKIVDILRIDEKAGAVYISQVLGKIFTVTQVISEKIPCTFI
ncbi:MAG: hypothetical protein HQP61_01960 [Peptococcaceae bacterium]|nr:hypothetical protein [Candidatus Syntrophopropionicum ammoniitolerans]